MASNTGEIITFVLTAFSTIIVIIPFILQAPSDNRVSDEIYRLRALSDTMNPNTNLTKKLWAYSTLHDSNEVKDLSKYKSNLPELDLAMAVMYYNDNDIDHSLTYLKSAKLHSPISCDKAGDICKRIWYLDRLLNSTKSADIKSQWHEDSKCNKQGSYSTSLCSESNLTSINDDISGLGNKWLRLSIL